jgi:isoaspartyl peptidase/L-asparaginase-like protein (Ntn-hydrolase superfamily)
MKRRDFVKLSSLGTTAIILDGCKTKDSPVKKQIVYPVAAENIKVISTWNSGLEANNVAFRILENNGLALDAIEKGLNIAESDLENMSVGIGGLPDANGEVTLDACIMDHEFNCGSVSYLKNIENPISVARKVMEDTRHVMLSGKGAYDFAIQKKFKHKELLTESSKLKWEEWKQENKNVLPAINHENHDTIAMIALDGKGNLSTGCTTSGWAYKLAGRVGDSPIIVAGFDSDNEVGAACATGLGEAIIKICGSHAIVELMRNGSSPQEACRIAIERIKKSNKDLKDLQVGFIAMNKKGEIGSYSLYSGFNYAYQDAQESKLIDSKDDLEWEE